MNLANVWPLLHSSPVMADTSQLVSAAGVLIAVTDSPENPEVVLTKRAVTMNTHAGQVAFPGGRWEDGDGSIQATALRESCEEIALAPQTVAIKGCLRDRRSLHGLQVFPFVGVIPETTVFSLNSDEIHSLFRVPLRYLVDSHPDRMDQIERHGEKATVPAWYYEGYEIWGLTALFLHDLVALIRTAEVA